MADFVRLEYAKYSCFLHMNCGMMLMHIGGWDGKTGCNLRPRFNGQANH